MRGQITEISFHYVKVASLFLLFWAHLSISNVMAVKLGENFV